MLGFGRLTLWAAGFVVAALAPAQAQISINAGRTPSRIYALQCEPCHDKPPALAKTSPARLTAFLSEHYSESRETAAVLADYLLKRASNAPEPRSTTRRRAGEAPPDNQAGDVKPPPRAATRSGSKREEGKAKPKPPEVKPLESGTNEAPSADSADGLAAESRPESRPESRSESQIEPGARPASGSPETNPAETRPTGDTPSKSSENKPSEDKPSSESKPSENKPSEDKPPENKSFDNKASDNKASETSASEPSEAPAGSRPSEAKPPEMPAVEPKATTTTTNSDTKPSE